jgi:hypothetical protein
MACIYMLCVCTLLISGIVNEGELLASVENERKNSHSVFHFCPFVFVFTGPVFIFTKMGEEFFRPFPWNPVFTRN